MSPTKLDSLKKDLLLFSYDFSSDENYCFRANSTRKSYKQRKNYPMVSSKHSQYMITQNWFHPKNTSQNKFYNSLKEDLVVFCKNNHAINKSSFASNLVTLEKV
jgi:hypothetical protein